MTATLLALSPNAAHASAPRATVTSPHGTLTATVTDPAGTPLLTVRRAGWVVLRAELGRVRTGAPRARIAQVRAKTSRLTGAYATTAGKTRTHRRDANQLTLRLGRARLELAAAEDGIAFRQTGFADPTVSYLPVRGSTGYLQRWRNNYEGDYPATPIRAARGKIAYPALLTGPHQTATLLTETGLAYGAPAEHLTATAAHPGVLATRTATGDRAPRRSSWRVAVIGSLADVVKSDLADEFAAPSQIADTSWIRPGRVAWSWWSEGNVNPTGGLAQQQRYVDFAAGAGFEYVLVDAYWDASWVPELIRYAAAKGVRVILWTDYKQIADPRQRAVTLDQWAAWGVAGVKADFFQSDSGARMKVMTDIARDAAARHLLVDFHGCTLPRGIQRTWPNVMTAEAVRGAEYQKDHSADIPALNVTLAFTRNAVASMDYTPVALSAANRVSTAAAVLAQSIVFESGLQHYADSPDSYQSRPQAMELLRQVPAAWDEVRLLSGAPRTSVTLARRNGADWYIGSISATAARSETVNLGFLDAGRAYTARVYSDGPADTISVTEQTVTSATVLTVPVAANGGFSVTLTPTP